jgi:hypothetical protein
MPIQDVSSKFYTESSELTTTAQTLIYTVPNNHSAIVRTLLVANTDASNRNMTLEWFHSEDGTTHSILQGHQISGSNFEAIFNDNVPLFLHAADKLYITAATANTLVSTICVEEYYDPNR